MLPESPKDKVVRSGNFPALWLELNLLTDETAAAMLAARTPESLEDPNTEHWRWQLFVYYYKQPHRDIALIEKLAAVAIIDPADFLQIAMKVDLMRLSDCPQAIIDEAQSSNIKPLRRAYDFRVQREKNQKGDG